MLQIAHDMIEPPITVEYSFSMLYQTEFRIVNQVFTNFVLLSKLMWAPKGVFLLQTSQIFPPKYYKTELPNDLF